MTSPVPKEIEAGISALSSFPDMFDKTKSGRVDVFGFSALWVFLQQWRAMFQQFDRDRSGSINSNEMHQGE